ncbi:MAG: M48 family metalloprotease [Desulfobacterota bacterium]|nr:M48 family metalloprotease [Thermodesulfobacteriota bacterium]
MVNNLKTLWLWYVSILIMCAGCMVNPVTLEQQFNVISEAKEISIGRNAHPQIVQQFGYYRNEQLQRYVNDVGQKLVSVCRRPDIRYFFTVLDTEMENAFALPGGYIYITRGLLALMNSEAELAGVLGHEIGHTVGRDSAALMSQNMVAQIAVLAGAAGAAATPSGSDIAMATSQLFNALMLGFSREREYLADEQSVEYLIKAGYDPLQMINFLRTLSFISQGPTGTQQYLTTHPYIFDRIMRVEAKAKVAYAMQQAMDQLQSRDSPAKDSSAVLAEKYKSMIDGLAYGPRNDVRHIKLYTVAPGDTFEQIARRTMGSSVYARKLAYLNGMPEHAQLIPGIKIKTIY